MPLPVIYADIRPRRDTAANWASLNPVLDSWETGAETDTGKRKRGDGATAWNGLSYEGAPGTGPWAIVAPPGGIDDTASIDIARTSAGVGGMLLFSPGVYIVSGLTASVANQSWALGGGSTLKLKNASNTPVIDVTANGVVIEGGGTIDGNRANQTSTIPGQTAGVRAVSVTKTIVQDLTIQNCFTQAVYGDAVTRIRVRRNDISGCCQVNTNDKAIYIFPVAGIGIGIDITDNVVDGTGFANGCIGIASATAGRTMSRIRIKGNDCLPGNAGATPTLAIELFTSAGAIQHATVTDNHVLGPVGVVYTDAVYGISLGGVSTIAGQGVTRAVVADNIIENCPAASIEIIASIVAVTGNVMKNSGQVSVNAGGSGVAGGIYAVSVTGNTSVDCIDHSYVFNIDGGTSTVTGLTVTGNTVRNPQGSAFYVQGTASKADISGNTAIACTRATAMTLTGTFTDSKLSDNLIDMTGAAANLDGILIGSTSISTLTIVDNIIKGASRYGIYGLAAGPGIAMKNNTISFCFHGIHTDIVTTNWEVSGNTVHDCSDRGIVFATVASSNLLAYGNNSYSNVGADYYFTGTTFAPFVVNGQTVTLP